MRKRHDPEHERWWVAYANDRGEEATVTFTWQYLGNGIYRIVPTDVTFDIFTPPEECAELEKILVQLRVRTVSRDV